MSMIGERIRVLRRKRGVTQGQLGDALGISGSAVGNYERGLREPDLDTIEAIADFFDVSIGDLMGSDVHDSVHEKLDAIKDGVFMSPAKAGKWVMLTKWFGNMNMPEFDMWFNAIAANHPDPTERNDDDDPRS